MGWAVAILPGGWQIEGLPATIRRAGPQAAERTVEFFTAQIRNPHTRAAYGTAVTRFFAWCDARGLDLAEISPVAVATYIEEMQRGYRAPTIKQHLAAIRRLFDWLVIGQVVPANPAASVRGPTHVVRTGKTPVLQPAEARLLLDTIDTSTLSGLRDRALLGVMVYSFARVSAVVGMRVEDYYQPGQMLVSRTTRTRGVHLLVDQVEDVLLVIPRIAILDLAHGQIQHAAAHGLINEPRKVSLLAPIARKKGANRQVRLFRDGQAPSGHLSILPRGPSAVVVDQVFRDESRATSGAGARGLG